MKKYYANIYNHKNNTQITIGEYSEVNLGRSIFDCIKQRSFEIDDCTWEIWVEII